ncbi:MAG: hypothetical protein K2X27_15555 [Candidatus Obscuribacterales bacterium]|nr:hypothetical protein [Candidatus Obscuribacterales bacterium]
MDDLHLTRNELLRPPPDNAGHLSASVWQTLSEHKLAIGCVVLAGVAVAAAGPRVTRALTGNTGEKAAQGVSSGAESKLSNAMLHGAENLGKKLPGALADVSSAIPLSKAAESRLLQPVMPVAGSALSKVGQPLAHGLEAKAGTTLPHLAVVDLHLAQKLLPGQVVPGAYSWGVPAAGAETHSLLSRIGTGTVAPEMSTLDKIQHALHLAQLNKSASAPVMERMVWTAEDHAAQIAHAANNLAEQDAHSLAQWILRSTHDGGASHAAPVAGAARDLLGFDAPLTTRPFVEQAVAPLRSSSPGSTFSRLVPSIGRSEMPALSVRRRPLSFE